MLIKFLLLGAIGKIFIYVLQIFPLSIKIKSINKFLFDLFECDFCLGCWVYFILNILFFDVWLEGIVYISVLSPFIMGVFTSFIVHLVSLGWRAKFEVIVLE